MDLENIRQLFRQMVPFVGKVGIEIDEVAPGHVKLRFPRDPSNFNHVGSYHAGALFTFAETAAAAGLAVTIDLSRYRLLVKHGEIDYRRGVYDDITCTVEVDRESVAAATDLVDREGRGTIRVPVTFMDKEGQACTTAVLTFHLKRLGS